MSPAHPPFATVASLGPNWFSFITLSLDVAADMPSVVPNYSSVGSAVCDWKDFRSQLEILKKKIVP